MLVLAVCWRRSKQLMVAVAALSVTCLWINSNMQRGGLLRSCDFVDGQRLVIGTGRIYGQAHVGIPFACGMLNQIWHASV